MGLLDGILKCTSYQNIQTEEAEEPSAWGCKQIGIKEVIIAVNWTNPLCKSLNVKQIPLYADITQVSIGLVKES